MNNKMDMTLAQAMTWVNRAIEQDQKDVAISILKDLVFQAVASSDKYQTLYEGQLAKLVNAAVLEAVS